MGKEGKGRGKPTIFEDEDGVGLEKDINQKGELEKRVRYFFSLVIYVHPRHAVRVIGSSLFLQAISHISSANRSATLSKEPKTPHLLDHYMDTPPSPPSIPLTSTLRTHPKRGLPSNLSSTAPHGHISGHTRTPSQQRAFDARKAEILRTMTADQIEARYQETVAQIRRVLEEDRLLGEKVESEMEGLRAQREMEKGIWEKLSRGRKEGG